MWNRNIYSWTNAVYINYAPLTTYRYPFLVLNTPPPPPFTDKEKAINRMVPYLLTERTCNFRAFLDFILSTYGT
jgi:hypothetical protein